VIKTTSYRTGLLSATISVAGLGYAGNYSGAYKNLFTLVFGNFVSISGVTATPSTVTVGVGANVSVTLNVTPTTRNETFTVTSSNTSYMTVSVSTTNANLVTVYGRVSGTANIVVTGSVSGKQFTIPVSIGNVYATNLTVKNELAANVANATAVSVTSTNIYILSSGTTYAFTATPSPANSGNVTWDSTNKAVATVSTAGLVTAVNPGSTAITARVQKSASEYIIVTINVTVIAAIVLTPNSATLAIDLGAPTQSISIATPPSSTPATGVTLAGYSWVSSNTTYATVSPASGGATTITAQAATPANQSAKITVSALYTVTPGYNYIYKVEKSVTVTVTGSSKYATNMVLTPSVTFVEDPNHNVSFTMEVGSTATITSTTTPATVTISTVTWTNENPTIVLLENSGVARTKNVTALAPGTVHLTAEIPISDFGGKIERTVTITVIPVSIAGITVNATKTALTPSDPTVALTFTILPNYAPQSQSVTWSSENSAVATVDSSGVVTAVGNGTIKIWVTLDSNIQIKNSVDITISGFPSA
jgi:uncharacterized protein YjdB